MTIDYDFIKQATKEDGRRDYWEQLEAYKRHKAGEGKGASA